MENVPFKDVFPIENGDFPASHVSLPGVVIAVYSNPHSNRLLQGFPHLCCSPQAVESMEMLPNHGIKICPATTKTPLLSIESWLVNRDPYFMVYYNPYITGMMKVHHPQNTLNNQGPFFHCSFEVLTLWWFVDAILMGFQVGF